MVNVIDARARKAEDALSVALQRYLDRSLAVILARTKGPKARKHTKWWEHTETKGGGVAVALEIKALDADYVVPDKLGDELADEIRPVVLRIATEAGKETTDKLGGDLAAFDADEVAQAVEDAIAKILGVADRHLREVRAAVLEADSTAENLDEVLDAIEAAHRKGGSWVLMSGRTLANALANDAALATAMKLGVTHTQWISRRDGRVRPTHVIADGQVRPVGERYKVGKFALLHPGDPSELPQSWPEVAGCRCGLLFRQPSDAARKMREMAEAARRDSGVPGKTLQALNAAVARAARAPGGETLTPTPDGYGLPPVASLIETTQPIVAYRALSAPLAATPGQRIELPGRPVLALAAPATAVALTVMIPAGVTVGVAGGALVLAEGSSFEVLAVSAAGAQVQVMP